MGYQTLDVEPLTGAMGAVIHGVDLTADLGNQAFDDIHQAFLEHKAIFFHGQDLDPHQQIAFARRFGPMSIYPFMEGLPEAPEAFEILKTEDDVRNFGGAWHSDMSFMPEHDIGVAVLMNTSAHESSRLAHMVAGYAYETLLGHPGVEDRYRAELAERSARSRGLMRFDDRVSAAREEIEANRSGEGIEELRAALAEAQGQGLLRPGKANNLGYALLKQNHIEASIAVFRFNAETHPDEANVHDSLGEAYEQAGRLELAKESYARAVALADAQGSDRAKLFRENLERVTEAMR